MSQDMSLMGEHAGVGAAVAPMDALRWRARWSVHKFDDPHGDIAAALQAGADVADFAAHLTELVEREG